MRAPIPDNQNERLADLFGYRVLHTEREAGFDDLVAIARMVCDVPIALVSLVSDKEQWFKAECGLGTDSTSLDEAICGYTILGRELLEIPDTRLDPRTVNNPLCSRPDDPLLFYTGAPLISPRGHALGALCVLDYKPRQLTDMQKQTLLKLAAQVVAQMELRKALHDQNILRSEMDHRVKNSLQTVESFARIYASRAKTDEAKDALAAIGRRVSSIANLHAELYKSDTGDTVRLDQYLPRIVDLANGSLPDNIVLTSDVAPVAVDSRKAACYAMIVSEFIANAVKYAFPDGRKGMVSIVLEPAEDGGVTLICADNGIGAKGAKDVTAGTMSIGLRLMESAASQTGSSFDVTADDSGYRVTVTTLS